jgi:hypothetical protein
MMPFEMRRQASLPIMHRQTSITNMQVGGSSVLIRSSSTLVLINAQQEPMELLAMNGNVNMTPIFDNLARLNTDMSSTDSCIFSRSEGDSIGNFCGS